MSVLLPGMAGSSWGDGRDATSGRLGRQRTGRFHGGGVKLAAVRVSGAASWSST
jgi:hypothetical protein